MPSGGSTPLGHEETEYVMGVLEEAQKNGLAFEFMMYFIGGLYFNKKHPREAAIDAALEWDF